MVEHIPTLGARFDLRKIGTEQNCWQVFWSAVRPHQILGAALYEGSIHRDDYCIAVQAADPAVVEIVREALEKSREFKMVCCPEPFVEGNDCAAMPLPRAGRIDESGNLVGDDRKLAESEATVVQEDDDEPLFDVVDSASTMRKKPASDRTKDLPELENYDDFMKLIKDRFVLSEPGYDRDLWITPKELCDVAEKYAPLLEIGLTPHHSDRAENALRVRINGKDRADHKPIELEGLYMFKSRFAVTEFLQSFISTPRYSDALPDLAGIIGRFHLHFGQPRASAKPADYSKEETISATELWPRLRGIRESFGDELNRAVDSLVKRRQAEGAPVETVVAEAPLYEELVTELEPISIPDEVAEEPRIQREQDRMRKEREVEARKREVELELATQDIRRSQGRCINCGKALGFSEKLKKLEKHKDCWDYIPE